VYAGQPKTGSGKLRTPSVSPCLAQPRTLARPGVRPSQVWYPSTYDKLAHQPKASQVCRSAALINRWRWYCTSVQLQQWIQYINLGQLLCITSARGRMRTHSINMPGSVSVHILYMKRSKCLPGRKEATEQLMSVLLRLYGTQTGCGYGGWRETSDLYRRGLGFRWMRSTTKADLLGKGLSSSCWRMAMR
jgi:hypothetical protein